MKTRATPAFLAFARAAAKRCATEKGKILFLSYNPVETRTAKGFKWVLNIVNRADFQGIPTMIVNGWEMLYQPEMTQRLNNGTLDFRDSQIIVTIENEVDK
jgi:hypothetical protein